MGETILTALAENAATMNRESKPAADRASAPCWIFHLVGDVHLPLHAIANVSRDEWPEGDKGGDDLYVTAREGRG